VSKAYKTLIPGAAYVRYSSSMQDDSFSLDAQLRQIKSRAAQDGVEIVVVFSDPAQSAYTKKYRTGVVEMLAAARRGVFKRLYVHKLDRLARRIEWAIEIVKELNEYGVTLKAVEQNFDLATPEGKLMFHLLGSLGEFYSDNLSKETHKGKYERAMQGFHNGWVPWGYVSELADGRKKAIPDEKIRDDVRQAFELYATGQYYDQGIADWINERGHKTFRGGRFTKDGIRDLLQNPFYMGYVRYRGVFVKGKERRGTGDLVKGQHEPLISEELFEKCQRVRAERRQVADRNQVTRRVYMLSSVIYCAHCGRRLRAQSQKHGWRYYRESSRFSGIDCPYDQRGVRAEIVEDVISNLIQHLKLPEDWRATVEEMVTRDSVTEENEREKIRLKTEIRRMREGYKHGLYEGEEFVFWREIESMQAKLKVLEQVEHTDVLQAADSLIEIAKAWLQATPEEKHELVKILLREIRYDFEKKRIVTIRPKPEYDLLFQFLKTLQKGPDGLYYLL
jgi:site-specific DNA recombinase